MTLALKYAARSDRGLHRSNNEDSVYAGPHLLAIADGMGGHAAGEVASKVVIAALAPLDEDVPGDDLLGKLHEAVVSGNDTIAELVDQDPDLEGMGTTLTAILFGGGRLGLVNIGDSRTYLLRDGQFNQITRDDSFVQSLLDEGRITPEEALTHPQRSLVLRALVGHEVIEPTLQVRETRTGDRYLLCSDGLSDVVGFEKLAETMQIADRQACADKMIELALQGGGPDNVTVIVADVVDEEPKPQATQAFESTGNNMRPVGPTTSPPRPPVPMPQQPPHQQPTIQQPPQPPQKKKKRGRKVAIVVAVSVIFLALVGAGIRYLAYTNYYVGVSDGGEIAVFQGVRGTVLGVGLHRKVEGSCAPADGPTCRPLRIDDLGATNTTRANEGVPVNDLEAARQMISTWRTEDQQQPVDCPTPGTSTSTDVPSFNETTPPPSSSSPASSTPPAC
ncbi:protein phosphatase 2C domain-containing protein [Kibdelosporangium philippinense]|uniref:Protein phosphatase 2C domain-containing protein n=1 Tax=Kibdelosporangium philippinense TaxID=211113 RepID=A0ABS8ZCA5_9PSEU|nr:protein phosphatase 2C domain-containing protein [Kibdelosporangium philippinense]MCE7005062.1 protein phosphatase 2C domain-containing protein [Kibdelosporangium philippinense]